MRINLTFAGDVEGGRFLPGVPAQDLELDDSPESEERYAGQIAENTQHQAPILITRRTIERLIVWGAEEYREREDLAARLAWQLCAGGIYQPDDDGLDIVGAAVPQFLLEGDGSGEALPPIVTGTEQVSGGTTTDGAEGASTGGETAGEAE